MISLEASFKGKPVNIPDRKQTDSSAGRNQDAYENEDDLDGD